MNQPANVEEKQRRRALIVLAVTVLIAIAGWIFIGRATESGIERLTMLDRGNAYCDSLWGNATSREDSQRVAMMPLRDTVDARSTKAIQRCGDLGKK